MSFYPTKRHLCLPRAVQMRIGGKLAERLDPGAGLLMHNTCAGCHRWTRFIIALRRYCRTLRSAKVDVRTFCYPRPARGCYANPTNPIKRTLPDKVVLHQVSLRDDEAIVGFSANDPATRRWCHVSAEEEKGGWSETEATFTLHLHLHLHLLQRETFISGPGTTRHRLLLSGVW